MSHRRRHQRTRYWSRAHRYNTAWARAIALYRDRLFDQIHNHIPIVTYMKSKGEWS